MWWRMGASSAYFEAEWLSVGVGFEWLEGKSYPA
jgi:hypothetical protein